jgi:hypothetical protein
MQTIESNWKKLIINYMYTRLKLKIAKWQHLTFHYNYHHTPYITLNIYII